MHLAQPLDAPAFGLGGRAELARVDQGQRPIAEALHAQRAPLDQGLPHGQGFGPGEAQVAADDELIPPAFAQFREHRVERADVAMDVGDAQESHRARRPYGPAPRGTRGIRAERGVFRLRGGVLGYE